MLEGSLLPPGDLNAWASPGDSLAYQAAKCGCMIAALDRALTVVVDPVRQRRRCRFSRKAASLGALRQGRRFSIGWRLCCERVIGFYRRRGLRNTREGLHLLKKKGTGPSMTAGPLPMLITALPLSYDRWRRGFALADVRSGLCGGRDAKESKRRCRQ